jgi:hypothetical protein
MRPGILESTRWVEGDDCVAELASRLPEARLVDLGDCEADMRERMGMTRDLYHAADVTVQ